MPQSCSPSLSAAYACPRQKIICTTRNKNRGVLSQFFLNLWVVALPNIPKKADVHRREDLFVRKLRSRTNNHKHALILFDEICQTRLRTHQASSMIKSAPTKVLNWDEKSHLSNWTISLATHASRPVRPSLHVHPPHLPFRDPCLDYQFYLVYFFDVTMPLYIKPRLHGCQNRDSNLRILRSKIAHSILRFCT